MVVDPKPGCLRERLKLLYGEFGMCNTTKYLKQVAVMTQYIQKACQNLLYVFDVRLFTSRMRKIQERNPFIAN